MRIEISTVSQTKSDIPVPVASPSESQMNNLAHPSVSHIHTRACTRAALTVTHARDPHVNASHGSRGRLGEKDACPLTAEQERLFSLSLSFRRG